MLDVSGILQINLVESNCDDYAPDERVSIITACVLSGWNILECYRITIYGSLW